MAVEGFWRKPTPKTLKNCKKDRILWILLLTLEEKRRRGSPSEIFEGLPVDINGGSPGEILCGTPGRTPKRTDEKNLN